MAFRFNGNFVIVLAHDFLEPLPNRLLDFIPREFNESSRRVKTFVSDRLLLGRKRENLFQRVIHFYPRLSSARFPRRAVSALLPPLSPPPRAASALALRRLPASLGFL